MKFKIVNEGSRGEVESYVGDWKDVSELVSEFIEYKNESENGIHFYMSDSEFLDLKFGGISDLDCFVEIIFDEEDCYKVYLLDEK